MQPITISNTGNVVNKTPAQIQANEKLPNTTQPSTAPTTEKITITQKVDGSGYSVKGAGIVDSKTPVGSQENYMNTIGNNEPATIDGINYSAHSLDQMQGRGILSPSVVKDAITNPLQIYQGNTPNTFLYIGNNGIRVVLNSSRKVITVY